VRTRRVRDLKPKHVEVLSNKKEEIFKPLHFIKRAIRR
jgi:hypothetical protein